MNLREWRETEGLTQVEAAKKCGLPPRTWERWECGRSKPNIEAAAKIIEASGGKVTVKDLASGVKA